MVPILGRRWPRTEYRGPDADDVGPFLDGYLVAGAHPHRQIAHFDARNARLVQFIEERLSNLEERTRILCVFRQWPHGHETLHTNVSEFRHSTDQILCVLWQNTRFRLLMAAIDLHQDWHRLVSGCTASVDNFRQSPGINGFDQVEQLDGVLHLVLLELSYHVPAHSPSDDIDHSSGLLDVVLTYDLDAGFDRGQDFLGTVQFCGRYQCDVWWETCQQVPGRSDDLLCISHRCTECLLTLLMIRDGKVVMALLMVLQLEYSTPSGPRQQMDGALRAAGGSEDFASCAIMLKWPNCP
jgi:hypothetical protein